MNEPIPITPAAAGTAQSLRERLLAAFDAETPEDAREHIVAALLQVLSEAAHD